MRVVTAPEEAPVVDLFFAGGITGCPDWQAKLARLLADAPGVAANPRQPDFNVADPFAAPAQIAWEYLHLLRSRFISFWFCAEQIQPIVLFELGRWSSRELARRIFVGADPAYPRRLDVVEQLRLERPGLLVEESLEGMAASIDLALAS